MEGELWKIILKS